MRRVGIAIAAACLLAAFAPPADAVVGGQPAPPGTFQYVANVRVGGSFGCSGTLIAPQWVLTAGHCGSATGSLSLGLVPTPVAWPAAFYDVRLGSVYAEGTGAERHSVSEVIVDSDYLVTNGTGNDVTLLRLDRPSRIAPVKIAAPAERPIWLPGALATIAGFGTTSQDDANPPPQMRYASVPITTDDYCARAYPHGLSEVPDDGSFDASTMLCAGYPQGGTDTCEGDSGGPLLARAAGGEPRLVGATSFGNGCAQPGKPGVYARIAEGPIGAFVARFAPDAFAGAPAAPARPSARRPSARRPSAHRRHRHHRHHRHHRRHRRRHRRGRTR
jgi:trypsin